jgi:hypothetical protein
MWLERFRQLAFAAFRFTQRLCAALIAGGMIAGFAGGHSRAPRFVLFAVFAGGTLAFGGLWVRVGWRAFNRLLAICILLTLLVASAHLLVPWGPIAGMAAVLAPLGAAAAATMAAVGFQSRQPDAKALRGARIPTACLALGLLACARWHEVAWRKVDSLVVVTGLLMAVLATVGVGTGNKGRQSSF